jgi:hypothetical protein
MTDYLTILHPGTILGVIMSLIQMSQISSMSNGILLQACTLLAPPSGRLVLACGPDLRTQMICLHHFSRASRRYSKVLQTPVDHPSVTGPLELSPGSSIHHSQWGTHSQNISIITYITTTVHGMARKEVEASSQPPVGGLPMALALSLTIAMLKTFKSESGPLLPL